MTISATDVRRAAMDLLARREHGAEELATKLQRRFSKYRKNDAEDLPLEHLNGLILQEVQKLTDSGLQSNARLAESFIRARANRGQGPLKIRMELRQKGISESEIELAMTEAATDWQAIAIEVAGKKFQLEDPDPKQRAKRQRFLQQRGFSFEHIQAVERH
jgi:regulatory protein